LLIVVRGSTEQEKTSVTVSCNTERAPLDGLTCSIFSLSGASPDHDGGWSFGSMAAAGGIGAAASKENNVLG
jgi:hypothetical protein